MVYLDISKEIIMRFLKFNGQQKWVSRRNHLVCELLEKDKFLTREKALQMANQQMKEKERKQSKQRAQTKIRGRTKKNRKQSSGR